MESLVERRSVNMRELKGQLSSLQHPKMLWSVVRKKGVLKNIQQLNDTHITHMCSLP